MRFKTDDIEANSDALKFSSSSNITKSLPANIELKLDFKGADPVSRHKSSPITYFLRNRGKVDFPMP